MTGIGEVEVVEICDGVSDFDWRIDTPEASIEPPLDEDFEQPSCVPKGRVDEFSALAESSSVFRRLQYVNHKEPYCPQTFPFLVSSCPEYNLIICIIESVLSMIKYCFFAFIH